MNVIRPIKSPSPANHDDAAHSIVTIITEVVKTEIGAGVCAFESEANPTHH